MKTHLVWGVDYTFPSGYFPSLTRMNVYILTKLLSLLTFSFTKSPYVMTALIQIRVFSRLNWILQETEWNHTFHFESHPNTAKHRVCVSSFKLCVYIKHMQTLDWNRQSKLAPGENNGSCFLSFLYLSIFYWSYMIAEIQRIFYNGSPKNS